MLSDAQNICLVSKSMLVRGIVQPSLVVKFIISTGMRQQPQKCFEPKFFFDVKVTLSFVPRLHTNEINLFVRTITIQGETSIWHENFI